MTSIFIFLSPIILGISQIVNPDATVWSFGFAALFAFLLFLKEGRFGMLALSSAFAGFALLSKYSATFILIFLPLSLFSLKPSSTENAFSVPEDLARFLKKALLGYVLFLIGALVIFALFMPAVFIAPELIYEGTIGFKLAKNVLPLMVLLVLVTLVILLDTLFFRARLSFRILKGIGWSEPLWLLLFCALPAFLLLASLANWSFGNFLDLPGQAL